MGDKEFKYLHIHKTLYFNANAKVVTVIWYLLFGAKSFYFLDRFQKLDYINRFLPVVRLIRVLQYTTIFYQKKKRLEARSNTCLELTTNVNGHCLLTLRQGEYKIINFKNNEVVTIFPEKIQLNEVERQVNNLIEAQLCALAPEVKSWDLHNRYIIESYINYRAPSYQKIGRSELYIEVFPLLKDILTTSDPEEVSFESYFQKLCKQIYEYGSTYYKDDDHSLYRLFDFIAYLQSHYDSNGLDRLPLVFSHGDFCDVNILRNNREFKIIDWSTLGKRSCYFDLYFLLFIRVSRSKGDDRRKLASEIEEDISHFSEYLQKKVNFLQELSPHHNYRYLFYLEFLFLRLQEILTYSDKPIDLMKWIKIFESYELETLGKPKIFVER